LEALLKSEPMQTVAERCNYISVEDLLAALGYGEITLNQVVNRLREAVKTQPEPEVGEAEPETLLPSQNLDRDLAPPASKSPIAGIEGMLYYIAGCCKPIPGEPIIGIVTRSSRGIAIHHQGCPNVEDIAGDRLIPVSWNPTNGGGRPQTYPIDIQIEAIDRVGVLKDILARLSDQNINVRNAGVKTSFGKPALISLSLDIRDRAQLQYSIQQIKNMSDILNVRRIGQIESK
jgi:GTP pyrophosphokinase